MLKWFFEMVIFGLFFHQDCAGLIIYILFLPMADMLH